MSAEIIHGDSLDVLRGMESGSVDAIITDPPFGVRAEAWDDMSLREFARFTMAWMAEARRVSPELLVFCTADSAIRDIARMLYGNVRQIIWHKPLGSQYAGASEARLWFAHEVVLHCHDRQREAVVSARDAIVGAAIKSARVAAGMSRGGLEMALRGKKTGLAYRWEEGACLPTPEQADGLRRVLALGADFDALLATAYASRDSTLMLARKETSRHAARAIDVLTYRTVTAGRHPCEKPVPLLQELITTVGADYASILDPFAGSGSTGVAAVQEGRSFTGVEQDAAYVDLARQRIADAQAQLTLGAA